MSDSDFPPIRPGADVRATLNRFVELGKRLRLRVAAPLTLQAGTGGQAVGLAREVPFEAVLAGDASPYSWQRCYRDPARPAGWALAPAWDSGTANAIEVNDTPGLGGRRARLHPAGDGTYWFRHVRMGGYSLPESGCLPCPLPAHDLALTWQFRARDGSTQARNLTLSFGSWLFPGAPTPVPFITRTLVHLQGDACPDMGFTLCSDPDTGQPAWDQFHGFILRCDTPYLGSTGRTLMALVHYYSCGADFGPANVPVGTYIWEPGMDSSCAPFAFDWGAGPPGSGPAMVEGDLRFIITDP